MEQVIENEGLYAQALTWQQLGTEVGIDAHWRTIRFSDKVHFGWGLQGKLRIIHKPGQQHCADGIQVSTYYISTISLLHNHYTNQL